MYCDQNGVGRFSDPVTYLPLWNEVFRQKLYLKDEFYGFHFPPSMIAWSGIQDITTSLPSLCPQRCQRNITAQKASKNWVRECWKVAIATQRSPLQKGICCLAQMLCIPNTLSWLIWAVGSYPRSYSPCFVGHVQGFSQRGHSFCCSVVKPRSTSIPRPFWEHCELGRASRRQWKLYTGLYCSWGIGWV